MEGSWRVHGRFMEGSWKVHGRFKEGSWKVYGGFRVRIKRLSNAHEVAREERRLHLLGGRSERRHIEHHLNFPHHRIPFKRKPS